MCLFGPDQDRRHRVGIDLLPRAAGPHDLGQGALDAHQRGSHVMRGEHLLPARKGHDRPAIVLDQPVAIGVGASIDKHRGIGIEGPDQIPAPRIVVEQGRGQVVGAQIGDGPDRQDLGVDLLALSGHKFYAPKGVGVLYVRQGTPLLPTQTGGSQERSLRSGTENVAYIVGLARALELAHENREAENQRLRGLSQRLIGGITTEIPTAYLTGHPTERLPNNVSFCFPGIEGESILLHLDLAGVAASSGSACTSGSEDPSHVLLALGLDVLTARGSLRLTLGHDTNDEDVNHVLGVLPGIISNLRAMSPLAAMAETAS